MTRFWLLRRLAPSSVDLLILYAALTLSFLLREPSLVRRDVFFAFLPLFVGWLGVFYSSGLYELRLIRDFVSLIGGLLASALVCWALGTTYFYFTTPYLELTPKTHLLLTIVTAHVTMLAVRRAVLTLTDFHLMRMRILLLADPSHGEHIRSIVDADSGAPLDVSPDIENGPDIVVADSRWIEAHWDETKRTFAAAVHRRIPIVSLESFYESIFGKISPVSASNPTWVLEHVLPRTDSMYFKIKRATDAMLSAVLLVLLAPVMFAVAVLIRVVDKMEPLYSQARVGYMGKVFTLWKFRSMRPGADAAGPFVGEQGHAELVTPLGSILRRFRLDELPQLWNVLNGDMSLVGPRPEWVSEVEVLERSVPHYHLRHLVPPGITGWAQVYFRATDNPHDSIEKHQYDLFYLKHFSFALDFTILLKTVKRVLIRDSRVSSAPIPQAIPHISPSTVDISSIISRN